MWKIDLGGSCPLITFLFLKKALELSISNQISHLQSLHDHLFDMKYLWKIK